MTPVCRGRRRGIGESRRAHAAAAGERRARCRAPRYHLVSNEFQRQNKRLQEHEEKLKVQNALFDAALNNMSQGLCMFDATTRLQVCNARYIEMYGLTRHREARVLAADLLLHRKQTGTFFRRHRAVQQGLLAALADGNVISRIVESGDGRSIAVVNQRPTAAAGRDPRGHHEPHRGRGEIKHMARHDALTNLPNRVAFGEQMEQALARVRRGDGTP